MHINFKFELFVFLIFGNFLSFYVATPTGVDLVANAEKPAF